MSPAGRCACETHCTAEGFAGTSIIMELMSKGGKGKRKKEKARRHQKKGDVVGVGGGAVEGSNNNNGVMGTRGVLIRPPPHLPPLFCNCLS